MNVINPVFSAFSSSRKLYYYNNFANSVINTQHEIYVENINSMVYTVIDKSVYIKSNIMGGVIVEAIGIILSVFIGITLAYVIRDEGAVIIGYIAAILTFIYIKMPGKHRNKQD